MNTRHSQHRHFIVAPLTIAIALMSVVGNQYSSDVGSLASNIFATSDTQFTFDNGAYGIVYSGGKLVQEEDHLRFSKGSALIATTGNMRTDIDDVSLYSLDGFFYLTKETQGISVAAITSPVAVFMGDMRMVVPIGMQWDIRGDIAGINDGFTVWMQSRTPQPIPLSFIKRIIRDFSDVPLPESILPPSRQFLSLNIINEEEMLLPVAQRIRYKEQIEDALATVVFAVEHEDKESVRATFADPFIQTILTTNRGQAVLSTVLHDVPSSQPEIRMLLLEQMISDEALWLTSSFHPLYRDSTWSFALPDVSVESSLTHAFLLPWSALSPDDFSDFVFQRFALSLSSLHENVGNTTTFVEHVLDAHVPLIARLEDKGYPQRASQLTDALLGLIAHTNKPSRHIQITEDVLRNRHRIDISPLPPKLESKERPEEKQLVSVPEPQPLVVLSPQHVEAMARTLLQDVGALFTVHTTIRASDTNTAHVQDIVFSSPQSDRTVSFLLDVEKRLVSDIRIDGQNDFPYTPSFEGFVQWVRK